MGRYKIVGSPLQPLPFAVLQGRHKGDEFDADVDPSVERALIGAGVLARLPEKRRAPEPEPAPEPKTEPKPAPEPEPRQEQRPEARKGPR